MTAKPSELCQEKLRQSQELTDKKNSKDEQGAQGEWKERSTEGGAQGAEGACFIQGCWDVLGARLHLALSGPCAEVDAKALDAACCAVLCCPLPRCRAKTSAQSPTEGAEGCTSSLGLFTYSIHAQHRAALTSSSKLPTLPKHFVLKLLLRYGSPTILLGFYKCRQRSSSTATPEAA